jgi:hypothetical protein
MNSYTGAELGDMDATGLEGALEYIHKTACEADELENGLCWSDELWESCTVEELFGGIVEAEIFLTYCDVRGDSLESAPQVGTEWYWKSKEKILRIDNVSEDNYGKVTSIVAVSRNPDDDIYYDGNEKDWVMRRVNNEILHHTTARRIYNVGD